MYPGALREPLRRGRHHQAAAAGGCIYIYIYIYREREIYIYIPYV